MTGIVVVGGGIAGLAAAYEASASAEVTLLEASGRVGGKLETMSFGGMPVERGADVFLARVPWGVDLAREVGLGDDLIEPSTSSASLWTRGRLRPLPDGLMLGVPTNLGSVARSGVLSIPGVARAGLDLVLPRLRRFGVPDDPSVTEVVAGRFGSEVAERLVAPLVGGINAGDIDRMSLRSVAPQLADAAASHRSLLVGLRAGRSTRGGAATTPATTGGPLFHSVHGGLSRLASALGQAASLRGAHLRVGIGAASVRRAGRRWEVMTSGGEVLDADGVILATPAPVTAGILAGVAPSVSAGLAEIDHASVSLLAVAYERDQVDHPLDGSGFLVPRVEGRLMTACTWYSSKWAEDAGEQVVFRISSGRYGDDRHQSMTNGDLTAALLADLVDALGVRGEPAATEVIRWPSSFPQYEPGHASRIDALESDLAQGSPGLRLAGSAYRGVGIPACINSGRAAARAVLDSAP
ncbi:MAG TPA: protoporphyrinogen oxidase [Acidimicrobiales bacterium]